MKRDFDKHAESHSEDTFDEEAIFHHHIMHFTGLTNEYKTWDEIINALRTRIQVIEELKAKGAEIMENTNDTVFYHIPIEHSSNATLIAKTSTTYTFQLDDGTTLTAPTADWHILKDEPINRRLVLLFHKTGEVQGIIILSTWSTAE